MKITKSQLKKIISEEVNKFLEEASSRWAPVNDPHDAHLSPYGKKLKSLRQAAIGPKPTTMSAKTKKPEKEELPADYKRIGPAGMGLKFEEESASESKNIIAAFQQLLAEEDVQAEILKVLEDKLKDVDLASLFSSEDSDLSALTEKRRK